MNLDLEWNPDLCGVGKTCDACGDAITKLPSFFLLHAKYSFRNRTLGAFLTLRGWVSGPYGKTLLRHNDLKASLELPSEYQAGQLFTLTCAKSYWY
jgi:hypothetical protein